MNKLEQKLLKDLEKLQIHYWDQESVVKEAEKNLKQDIAILNSLKLQIEDIKQDLADMKEVVDEA